MIFGSENVLLVYEFLKTYFMMVTYLNDYVKDDDDDDDKDDFGYHYRDNMIGQFKQYLNNKNFSPQIQDKCNEGDFFQRKNKLWLNVIDMGGPIPGNVYDYEYNDSGKNCYFRGAERDPENGEFRKNPR